MVKLQEDQKKEIIRQERERRRVARIIQVRQQSSTHAKLIREVVKQKKNEIIKEIRAELHAEVQTKVSEISDKSLAHVQTPKLKKPQSAQSSKRSAKAKRRRPLTEDDLKLAQKRNQTALKKLNEAKAKEKLEREARIEKRRKAEQIANQILKNGPIIL